MQKEEKMKSRVLPIALILVVLLASCNLPSRTTATTVPSAQPGQTQPSQTQPGNPTAKPSDTPTLQPTDTPIPSPTDTPTITLTFTPEVAMVTPKTESVNCRFGPGVDYLTIGGLKTGDSVPILGQNGDGTWWQIQNPNNIATLCWVSDSATLTSGNMAGVPVAPSPQAYAISVKANTPAAISVPGCIGPIQPLVLTGTIETNGPIPIVWHFETQQGGALPSHTVTFTKYGTQTVTESSFTPPLVAGTYWLKLFVTSPNSLTAEASYTIACP
jgi:cell wall-associated NlpC family hydrolase